jgi:uncharacterized protein (TIGR02147 family)
MKNEAPSIYHYNDFRKFIADYQEARQNREPSYTKSFMSKKLGLPNSRSYLSHVLNGLKITETFVERFIVLFGFNQSEGKFFRMLVKFNQASNPADREMYFERLITLNKTPKKHLYENSYHYYKDWYNSAIRALLNVVDFDGRDYPRLARRLSPPITANQAKSAVGLLLKMGLIAKNKAGFYKLTSMSIGTEELVRNEAVKQFQLRSLDLAKSAIMSEPQPHKIMTTNTVSISKSGRERIEKLIGRFRCNVRSVVHKDDGDPEFVYQINVQFFPMTK